ncbi:hypothetical protein [Inconstantimicrobium mannanitabidum]|uniref:Uncharacterized protein n=1 Tax=Inconstantimicrobium mannanitabidum TaxID=1604901 RepID=A0ACB5R8Y8_9CLOT|nr:hypothetical protein [Clostridium sp. TW13]GKX65663.1 hypothetical protein rsdtw13_09210 [Clostridium sp. TW13]
MLTERDTKVLKWIEDNKVITIEEARYMFFEGNYKVCWRRLDQLEQMEILKSYKNKYDGKKVYYQDKKISSHDLFIHYFLGEIYKRGGELLQIKYQPRYLNDLIRPDSFLAFKWNNRVFLILLEVDYTHFTDTSKFILYEKMFKEDSLGTIKKFGTFPKLLIVRPNLNTTRYSSKNFEVIYTTLNYKNLDEFLFIT